MPFVSECPSCGQKLKVPDDLAGKKVRCSKCAGTFVAESITERPAAAPPPPPRSRHRDEEPEDRYDDEERPARRSRRRRDDDDRGAPGRGGMLLTFGILSIALCLMTFPVAFIPFVSLCTIVMIIAGLVFGILAWAMGGGDLKRIRSGQISREAEGSTKGGYITGIIGTILNSLLLLCGCIGLILVLAFGIGGGFFNRPGRNPPFGPGPGRFSLQLPQPKLADHMPDRIPMKSP